MPENPTSPQLQRAYHPAPGRPSRSPRNRVRRPFNTRLALLVALVVPLSAIGQSAEPPRSLFNGRDLRGWSIYIQHKDKRIDPRTDPKRVFEARGSLIHVSGEEFGALTTDEEFENYHLLVEFRWGNKKWPPRENAPRDSGILVHTVAVDKIWPRSIECQIQEHDCGDFWMVDGATLTVDGKVEGQFKKKKVDAEKPTNDWNTVEVICDGGKITNIINGVIVNEGTDASVRKGRILLQSEGAEIFFRKVELTRLKGR